MVPFAGAGGAPGSIFTDDIQPESCATCHSATGVDYVSAANNAGCEKCHTEPYLKHGYIYAQVDHDATNDFYTCKACHLDNGEDWEESGDARLAS